MKFLTATDRYIFRLVMLPLLATLAIAASLLLLEKMLNLFDFVAAEGGPVSVVWRMLANLMPEYLSLGIPIGLLLGILLAFRRLATSSELDIFRAVGMSYFRLLRVPFMLAIGLAVVNFAIVGFIQPSSRYLYEELRFELRSGAFGAKVRVGEFNNVGKNLTVRIDESRNNGNALSGLFVFAQSNSGQTIAVTAEQGQFLRTDDPDTILLRLEKGTLVHDAPNYESPRVLSFTSHDIPIPLPKIENFRTRGGKDREYLITELIQIGLDAQKPELDRNRAWANFHFRLVEVAMMLLLPLLALALAIPPKRSTSALGVFLSIVMVVTYHKINEYAEGVGGMGIVDPFIALWLPFLLFAGLILWMYHIIAHVPGGQPIGALEVFATKSGKWVKRMFRFGRKSRLATIGMPAPSAEA
ncbi:LPS export ABC transporter permease LptF [Sphingorhabdus wooponensis]|uniref:LPS export ABC transporter permease LptF n=1 Tax=Sphingorhabdus wooponensis TaxID=940136 RepID=A0A3R8RB97_9SPHN|nr:LPS export ABC transporter permease LptF [Sphingorhabdus wooponensis]RRQ51066.1 LPS export ABC transporter permease LptF [Sphingorhabdus wooponensis]